MIYDELSVLLFNDRAICPYCSHEYSNSHEFVDAETVQCEQCDKEFFLERNIEITFTTAKLRE